MTLLSLPKGAFMHTNLTYEGQNCCNNQGAVCNQLPTSNVNDFFFLLLSPNRLLTVLGGEKASAAKIYI